MKNIFKLIGAATVLCFFCFGDLGASDSTCVEITDKNLDGPGIAYSTAMNKTTGPSGESVWVVPLPELREEQWPFYWSFYSDKPDKIKLHRIYERGHGHWMLEVLIKPLKKDETINWGWGAYSLQGAKDYSKCPKDAKICSPDKYPAEIREYLKSSKALQLEHPEIKAKAGEFKKGTNNVLEIADRIYKFMDEERPRKGNPDSGDALESLRKNGGSCTNYAILTAALFRACGIPARVLACYPTWFHGSLAAHYDVEYYVPGFGWKQMDTISARKEVQPYEHVVVSSVMITDEDNGMDATRYGVWLGVPRYTLRERVAGEAEGDEGNETFGFATAGGIKEFKGDISEASGLAKAVWEKFLGLKKDGKESKQAEAFQLAAARSQTLKEFTNNLSRALKIYNGKAVKEEAVSANLTDRILLSVSANKGHGWSDYSAEFYEKYLLGPLKKKLGEKLIVTHKDSTLENMQKILKEQNPFLFVWIGGGLHDAIELNKTVGENVDFVNVKPAAELDLKERIVFINCEFAAEVNKTLKDCRAAFGYWTEMSTASHYGAAYKCDYFADEPQPLDWYAPYFINMRKVIEDIASGATVKEAAAKADIRWKGFLEWIKKHPEIPFRNDYLELKMDWSDLTNTIIEK